MSGHESWDVVIIGGGIMGSSSALALARRGARVVVLERSIPGAEASSAAAGILGAQIESHGPGRETDLFVASRALYPSFVAGLTEASGIDVGYRPSGSMRVATDANELEALSQSTAWQPSAGLSRDVLDPASLAAIEPSLAAAAGAVRFADDAVVDPPVLFRALQIAATHAGVVFRSGTQVRRVIVENGRAGGVLLEDGAIMSGDHTVLAAGSWSALVDGVPLAASAVKPARGQMLELTLRMPILKHVVFGHGAYLVPRADGRVLVGSTLEFVGFHKDVTAKAVRDLLVSATALCPALEDASLSRTWSSFRPFAESPLLGASELPRLILATGHYRNGILLAPLTGDIVALAIEGKTHPVLTSRAPSLVTRFRKDFSAPASRGTCGDMPITYRQAGVDIDAGDELVERIKPFAKLTRTPHVLADVGGFAGLCRVPAGIEEPILVSGTDGVGTKLKVAFATGKHDTIGQDLVAMCVNDIVTCGASPLFFLDYFATAKLELGVAEAVIKGIAEACTLAGCALLGGETAELPGMYADGEYDLAGFAVGVVGRKQLLDGTKVTSGDVVLGLPSSGLHSNGYSLARRALFGEKKLDFSTHVAELGMTVGEALLIPTRIYAKSITTLLEGHEGRVHAMSHITGGGLPGNVPRVLPDGLGVVVNSGAWKSPAIFELIAKHGPVETSEMRRAFNLGVGFLVVVDKAYVNNAMEKLTLAGEKPFVLGEVEAVDASIDFESRVRFVS